MDSILLSFTTLHGHAEPAMLREFTSNSTVFSSIEREGIISPLYAHHGDLTRLQSSCPFHVYRIIDDVYNLTQTFLKCWGYTDHIIGSSSTELASCDAQLQQIYTRILFYPSTEDDLTPDWLYESCRIAALIYGRSIVYRKTLADSANILNTWNSRPDMPSTTLLSALLTAFEHTDIRNCWGGMRGVFLWVCLVGGAGCWPSSNVFSNQEGHETPPSSAWARKCFTLYAIRASITIDFKDAGAIVQTLRTMLQVRHWMDWRNEL
jgi:hypothetical protein